MKTASVVAVVLAAAFSAEPQQDKLERAKEELRNWTRAVEVYNIRHASFPESLKMLTERFPDGSPALAAKETLNDPWGRPYKYDPKMLDQKTGKPLIWSEGPDPKDSKGWIKSWDLSSDKKESLTKPPTIKKDQ
jgi:Type II secretion system (T2SS), protein G